MSHKKITLEELAYWEDQASKAAKSNRYKIDGAICAIKWALRKPRSLQELRDEFEILKEGRDTPQIKDIKFDVMRINRDLYRMRAIKKLGIRLKEVDSG